MAKSGNRVHGAATARSIVRVATAHSAGMLVQRVEYRLIGETSVGCVHGRRDARIGTAGRYAVHPLPGIVKFRSAIPADLVGPPANCEQSAEIVVATAEQGRKNPLRQSFHRRWDPRFLKNSRLRQSSATENDRSHERGLPRIAHFHWPLVPIENVCKIDHFGGRGP